ncbi:hypothetical protein HMPREF9064_1710 [Aggregatibacter segnis ATCC 33393]|uniref:Uncharacterized protein n=1 Tax=Aggregatibacter segnis ATCC 33393 TaxID=888057 RepID=E6KZX8_9PAST|nr:hypothetical protein HMPREF9064_1710 [Aggregatibacter segnis ATCC 33393]
MSINYNKICDESLMESAVGFRNVFKINRTFVLGYFPFFTQ